MGLLKCLQKYLLSKNRKIHFPFGAVCNNYTFWTEKCLWKDDEQIVFNGYLCSLHLSVNLVFEEKKLYISACMYVSACGNRLYSKHAFE